MQDWVVTGVPPWQPEGAEAVTALVCVLSLWQVPQSLYVKEVQAGGTYVQDWERIGEPPVQPEGVEAVAVRDCVLSG